jgi:hypothetical protein
MDKREFTVIENETKKEVRKSHATNPIAKNFDKFHNDKKFSVKDLFKK